VRVVEVLRRMAGNLLSGVVPTPFIQSRLDREAPPRGEQQ